MTAPDGTVDALAALGDRLAVASTIEEVVDGALAALDELLGHPNALLLVHHAELDRLVTLASRGYDTGGIGSEVEMGAGVIGMVAARRRPMRIGNLQRMLSYARTVQRTSTDRPPETEIRLPGLADARSQLAAPLVARNALVGVLAVESTEALAYDDADERVLVVAAHLIAAALDREQVAGDEHEAPPSVRRAVAGPATGGASAGPPDAPAPAPVTLRHYAVDGSTFLDDSYVIKGVAGRLLWKVAAEHVATGRTSFTNREAKLDPALELPPFRDNFESRLILLKRRLEDRGAPLRIVAAGRGCFDLDVRAPLTLEHVPAV